MTHRGLLAGLVTVVAAVVSAMPIAAAEPTAEFTAEPGAGHTSPPDAGSEPSGVWLKGAFGRVQGGPTDEPAVAPPDGRALDAWMRSAPLELTTDAPAADGVALTVIARAVEDGTERPLSTGATEFVGPDEPGQHVLVASVGGTAEDRTEHAWLVDVPDRSGSPELLWEIPGPVAILGSTEGEVSGEPGHGCYAYLCVEAGYRPPTDSLEPLVVAVGETPQLRLDDGSALVHWEGRLEPLEQAATQVRVAEATFADEPAATPRLAGLEPTVAGEWLLEVRADYDRERGWQWFLFRLLAD